MLFMREEKTIPRHRSHLSASEILQCVEGCLNDHKADDILTIDLTSKTSIADTMIVASGGSHRHVAALADHVIEELRRYGVRACVEGKATCDWVLIDAGDLLIHIFRPEVRAFYALEKMWGEGHSGRVSE